MTEVQLQRTEGPRTVIVRALIGHLALFGVFFVPMTRELLIAALIGFFIRVFSIEGGVVDLVDVDHANLHSYWIRRTEPGKPSHSHAHNP